MILVEKFKRLHDSHKGNIFVIAKMNPELLKALEANMFDHHEYEVLEAEAFLKGQANGAKHEREKNEARDSKRADYLRSQNVPENVISAMLALK